MISKITRKLRELLKQSRMKRYIRSGDPVPFTFKGRRLYLNPEKLAVYHIENSTEKISRMINLVSGNPKTILDVGANCGIFAALAGIRFPDATIHAFEPSVDLIPLIRKNCDGLNVEIHQTAVGDESKTMTLYVNPDSQQTNSLNREAVAIFSPNDIASQTVECITLDDFVTNNQIDNVDVLKVDVQGFEGAVFRGAKKTLEQAELLFIESTWIDIESIIELLPLALHYGFSHAAVIDPVYMGADIMFARKEIAPSDQYRYSFALDDRIQPGRWL